MVERELFCEWINEELTKLNIDNFFTHYLISMLEEEQSEKLQSSLEATILPYVFDQERIIDAQNFIKKLIFYDKNPTTEIGELTKISTTPSSELDISLGENSELKATAATFVPSFLDPKPEVNAGEKYEEVDLVVDDSTKCVNDEGTFTASREYFSEDTLTNEDTFLWAISHELLQQLIWKYPDYDPSALLEIVYLVDFDVDRAAVILKNIAEKEQKEQRNVQVCRHYLEGNCRRSDCLFLHDTNTITCRYWLRGNCFQYDQCVFLHGFDSSIVDSTKYYEEADSDLFAEDNSEPKLNEENFPSLCGKENTKKSTAPLNFVSALNTGSTNIPKNERKSKSPLKQPRRSKLPHCQGLEKLWVSTGATVGKQYGELRAEASDLARARNQCFMNATKAYRSGNKAKATQLSKLGQEYNWKMKECHFQAASAIFQQRNPPEQIITEQIMDLHGLHVAECIELLSKILPQLKKDCNLDYIQLITGSGHHSVGPQKQQARLRPAVESFLYDEEYQYNQIADSKGHVGMLQVYL